MSDRDFKVKCIKDYSGCCRKAWSKGKIYEYVDGSCTREDGLVSCGYDSFDDLMKHNSYYNDYLELVTETESQLIIIYKKGNQVVATYKEGKEIIKTEIARCCPTDDFIFNEGAKIAFDRLMGTVEVKDAIEDVELGFKIVKQDKYNIGDKVKIRSDLENNVTYGNNSTTGNMISLFGKEVEIRTASNGYGYGIVESLSYSWTSEMIEGKIIKDVKANKEEIETTYKEVPRKAKVGERIKL